MGEQQGVCWSFQPLRLSGFYPLLVLRGKEDQAGSKAGWESASIVRLVGGGVLAGSVTLGD